MYQKLKAKALRTLARRDHSRQELHQKLSERCEDQALIEKVLDECEKNHWLDETRFAQMYIRSRAQKHYGPKKIRYELQQRGLTMEMIDEAFTIAEIDWDEMKEAARQKKFGSAAPSSWQERAKQSQYLYQRGF